MSVAAGLAKPFTDAAGRLHAMLLLQLPLLLLLITANEIKAHCLTFQ